MSAACQIAQVPREIQQIKCPGIPTCHSIQHHKGLPDYNQPNESVSKTCCRFAELFSHLIQLRNWPSFCRQKHVTYVSRASQYWLPTWKEALNVLNWRTHHLWSKCLATRGKLPESEDKRLA